jgi:hypothetical protein
VTEKGVSARIHLPTVWLGAFPGFMQRVLRVIFETLDVVKSLVAPGRRASRALILFLE